MGRHRAAARPSRNPRRGAPLGGGLPQPRRDSAAAAATRLDRLERARAAYDAERALEDPFALAELRTTGEASAGRVVSAEPSRTAPTSTGRTVLRPRFTVRTSDPVRIEPGRTLICPARTAQRAQVISIARPGREADVTMEITQGMGTPARPRANAVPEAGEPVSYTLDPGYWAAREFPPAEQTPWTHGGPPARPAANPAGEPRP